METNPTIAAASAPSASAGRYSRVLGSAIRSFTATALAAMSAGIDIRKLKRAAAGLSRSRTRPPEIVAAERETPGKSASDCATPMTTASSHVSESRLRVWRPSCSLTSSRPAVPIRIAATMTGLPCSPSKKSLNSRPTITAGTVATAISQPNRASTVPKGLPFITPLTTSRVMCHTSFQKYKITAASVPSCSSTSNTKRAFSSNVHPNSHGIRMRCAVDETGMNSVRPCTMPRTKDLRRVIELGFGSWKLEVGGRVKLAAIVVEEKVLCIPLESPIQNRRAHFAHEGEQQVDVVLSEQHRAEDFVRHDEVAHVGAGEVRAAIARAALFHRARIAGVGRVLHVHPARARQGRAVARQPGGQDAVEDVHAAPQAVDQILRRADAHEVARLVGGQNVVHRFERRVHLIFRLAHRQPADGIARKSEA